MNKNKKNYHALSVSFFAKKIFLFYKNTDKKNSPLTLAKSDNGISFYPTRRKVTFTNFLGFKKEINIPQNFTVSILGKNEFFLSYKEKIGGKSYSMGAVSKDGFNWTKPHILKFTKEQAIAIKTKKSGSPFALLFGDRSIKIAYSETFANWHVQSTALIKPREKHFDNLSVSIANAFSFQEGLAVFYIAKNKRKKISLGVALLDKKDPEKILWRSPCPAWEAPKKWKTKETSFVGIINTGRKIITFWENAGQVHAMPIQKDWKVSKERKIIAKTPKHMPKLEKFSSNPIIGPNPENYWESNETFNPAAINIDGKIHLLYRAIGRDGSSVFGYACSYDGFRVNERLKKPAYVPTQPFEFNGHGKLGYTYPYMSGGGWGGCEDPRLSQVGDRIFMTYTAFNGWQPPGVALTSISVADFLEKKWKWEKPILISRRGEIQKNWVIFPEKINGQYVVLHNINPVSVEYFNDLKSAENSIHSKYNNKGDENSWDNVMRGAAAPPLKTKYGWLLFYHAMDTRDPKHYLDGYWSKVGVMILDYKNPEKILYKSKSPILEAEEYYEKNGAKPGVIYVCGTVIKNDKLFVYYGAADSVSCVATAPIDEFLTSVINSNKPIPFKKVRLK